ncbi:WD40/YVTN/BNR-like repeat-containing protein [Polyangium fumosum]|uniref:DUF6242 domain-containing protein n=1 Tax=Polyangium fumosum TaxID=889272 RepID=A0A4U1JJ87_9BACT|nr:hypothetical protein [Polyangium fumosum]TKD12610.1 hypothetical protein E8A74_02330 [Polyangium fumosum]
MARRVTRFLHSVPCAGLAVVLLASACGGPQTQTTTKPVTNTKTEVTEPEDEGPALGPLTLTLPDAAASAWVGQRGNYVDTLSGIWGLDKLVIAVGGGGTILRSEDAGINWTRQASPKDAWLRCVWGSGPDDIYVVGGNAIMHSTDGGITWTPQKIPITGTFFMAVWGSGRDDVYVVGGDGNILNTTDGGKTWTKDTSGVVGTLYDVWGSGADDIYVVGQASKDGAPIVLQSKIGGHLWAKLPVDTLDAPLRQIDGASIDYLYAVSAKGTVYESNNRAATWKSIGSFDGDELLGIRVVGKGDLYVIGRNQQFQHTTDGGKTWKDELNWPHGAAALQGIWGKGPTELFLVGEGTLEAGQKGSLVRRR